jgi:hypothetical protein
MINNRVENSNGDETEKIEQSWKEVEKYFNGDEYKKILSRSYKKYYYKS